MDSATATFAHEYDLDALVRVTPRGHAFSLLVTPRYRDHYEVREYEPYSARFLAAILRRSRLFVDVGAHYGFFSIVAARASPALEILAFEPVPETFEVLRRNVASLGGASVAIREAAVSDDDGRASFQVSLASDSSGFYTHPNAATLRRVDVACVRLDSVLAGRAPCPAVVKIDTEGHELAVLRGMRETLARFPDLALLVEFCPATQRAGGTAPEELLRELDRLGFAVFLLDEARHLPYRLPPDRDWRPLLGPDGYANLYCVRKERALDVCFFSHGAHLEGGGAERELLDLVSGLVADRGAVCTVVLPGAGTLGAALRSAGAGVLESAYPWWCFPAPFEPGPQAREDVKSAAAGVLASVVPALLAIDPDVIATQTLAIPWGAVAAAWIGKPHVWSVCEFGRRDHDLRFALPFETVVDEIASSSAFVFTSSDAVRRELFPGLGRDRCRPLYQHIAVDAGAPGQPCFTRPGALRVGHFATLAPGKGQEDAIRAVARLAQGGVDAELLLAGGGPAERRAALAALAVDLGVADRVRLAGFLEAPFAAMREADVLLQCSRSEAFGRSAVEAMLLGKPLVYAAAGGLLEYLEDGRTGLAYPPGDDGALARAIARLAASPAEREALGAAARESALARFTRDAFWGEFFRVAKGIADAPPPARLGPSLRELASSAIARTTAEMEQLRSALPQRERALAERDRSLAERDRSLAERDRELAAAAAREEALRAESAALRADLEASRRAAADAARDARRLELDLAAARGELTAVAGTASWRWTRPLRKWGRSFRKRRDALVRWLARRPARAPDEETARLIAASGEFDGAWYLQQNPDVAAAGMDPLRHFVVAGAREGRSPSRHFDMAEYLRLHPDALDAPHPFLHHLRARERVLTARAGPPRAP